ncbi:Por secretion system C-terminal sorting domain-containing protein [Flexibacter flexilis DSM 6793]|uniref:Por secretion system C-terminal sorting domain-containing protein n=1 Tax=Flexibacter flexilis DSM 6793 TaxID=927664 RepID=A0A1I1GZ76_9BACT|nr:T9SS type A sorting domain-containing protein [Flexibacter flexilis]SFC16841.1 Por secretion system C-terminal sorting domain-containing protein [Flexibacter flexilis DSM 6793]
MKKFTLTVLAAALSLGAAQAQFFTPTTYKGAFGTTDWTSGWANFDPKTTEYPGDAGTTFNNVTIAAGNITSNTTWTKNNASGVRNVYRISGYTYVDSSFTLTIEPGTIIRGSGTGTLVIKRGAKINANGTAADPIIFTSGAPVGVNRKPGNWGGLVLCGAATHNIATGTNAAVEGGIAAKHGGNDDNDNSGVLRYVRIEFPGQPLTAAANSEINGLSMYSVGRGTQIDHIQVSFSGDDSYEWFGGTVDAKYLIASRGQDDDFDTDNGFRGRVQFAVAQRDTLVHDQSGSNGFESDNDVNGTMRTPQTRPFFSNVTLIGPMSSTSQVVSSEFKRVAHIRRNSACSIYNSAFAGFPVGLLADGKRTGANIVSDTLQIQNTVFAGIPASSDITVTAMDTTVDGTTLNLAYVASWLLAANHANDTLATAAQLQLTAPFNLTAPNFLPLTGSPLLSGASFSNVRLGGFTSVKSELNKNIKLGSYPNPTAADAFVNVILEKASEVSVSVQDVTGKTVLTLPANRYEVGSNDIMLPTSQLNNGIYSILITTNEGRNATRLVVNR